MEQFGAIVALVFGVYGVLCALRAVAEWIEGNPKCITVLPLKGHHDDAELQIRAAVSRHRGRCLVVDMGLDGETKQLIKTLCVRLNSAEYCCPDTLNKQLIHVMNAN